VNRAEQREQSQADILAAAAAIIARHGYHGTSMRELARATRRGLSSFYTYFPSKEALLFALQIRAFVTLTESAEVALALTSDVPEGQLYAFILNHVRYFTTHTDVMRVLVQEAKKLPAAERRRVRALKERYYRMAERIVQSLWADRAGSLGVPATRAHLERATYNLFGMLNWVYAWFEPRRHGPPEEAARTIHAMMLGALSGRRPERRTWIRIERALDRLDVRSLISPEQLDHSH
jgi:AcrR family transcriptional regulator